MEGKNFIPHGFHVMEWRTVFRVGEGGRGEGRGETESSLVQCTLTVQRSLFLIPHTPPMREREERGEIAMRLGSFVGGEDIGVGVLKGNLKGQ